MLLFSFFFCCKRADSSDSASDFAPEIHLAYGKRLASKDFTIPLPLPISQTFKGAVCYPLKKPTNTNTLPLEQPQKVKVGQVDKFIPGQNGCALPAIHKAIHHPVPVGIPEISVAKDAHISNHNPDNFSSFSVLQGLKHIQTTCLLSDHDGYLWIGTDGGGLCRYDGKQFFTYTEQAGLLNNNIASLFQDKDGNIWIGFWGGGISKYDGKNFFNYLQKEGFTDAAVDKIIQDRQENLWFCTEDGLIEYDGNNFIHFTEQQGLTNLDVLCAKEDKQGNLWFGTAAGLTQYDGKAFYQYTEKNGLRANSIYSICLDQDGLLWLGSTGGIATTFDGSTFSSYPLDADCIINCIYQDQKANIWLTTDGAGLLRLNDGKKTITHFTEKQGLENNFISDLIEDRSGVIWLSSLGGGLVKYQGNMLTHLSTAEGLSSNIVFNILNDRKGDLWLGTRGGGLAHFDRKKNTFEHYFSKDGLGQNLDNDGVFSLLEDRDGNIWCGTWGGGVSKFNGKNFETFTIESGLCGNDIRCMYQDKSGAIWFGSWNNGVSQLDPTGRFFTNYTTKEGLSLDDIKSIIEDRQGNIWIGTKGGGLTRLDRQRKIFTHFTEHEGFFSNDVSGIVQDQQGLLWISSVGKGLIRFDPSLNKFTRFGEKEGLSNNNVLSIALDKADNIWLGSRSGLSKMSRSALLKLEKKYLPIVENRAASAVLFKNYSYEDGFLGVSCYLGAIQIDQQGEVWVGASDRLSIYHPVGDKIIARAPEVALNNISLFNESIPWSQLAENQDTTFSLGNGVKVGNFRFTGLSAWQAIPEYLSLAYNNNFLSFGFIGISTKSPNKMRYQYQLEGLDKNWSGLSVRTEAPYGNLAPGNYTFKVKAMNEDGYWSKALSYPFTIRPPWWKTWWAYALYFMLLVLAIYAIIQFRTTQAVKKIKALESMRTKISSDLHDDVGSILSGLAMQSQMLAYAAAADLKPALNELSAMSREAMEGMRDTVWLIDSRKDKFENLIDRMRAFAEKNLGSKNIKYQFQVNHIEGERFIDPEKRQNIYLIFKEALTNILKHSDASQVDVVFEKQQNQLRLLIHDNGSQTPQSNSDGMGMSNMAMRAKNIGATLTAGYEKGFQVELILL